MSGDPAKAAVVMDACSMKRILSPATRERDAFDAIRTACGRFVVDRKLAREYAHAFRREGGAPDDLQRMLEGLPAEKRVVCPESALAGGDDHLLVAAIAEGATLIISSDSTVLQASGLVMRAEKITVFDAEAFLKARAEAGFGAG